MQETDAEIIEKGKRPSRNKMKEATGENLWMWGFNVPKGKQKTKLAIRLDRVQVQL